MDKTLFSFIILKSILSCKMNKDHLAAAEEEAKKLEAF